MRVFTISCSIDSKGFVLSISQQKPACHAACVLQISFLSSVFRVYFMEWNSVLYLFPQQHRNWCPFFDTFPLLKVGCTEVNMPFEVRTPILWMFQDYPMNCQNQTGDEMKCSIILENGKFSYFWKIMRRFFLPMPLSSCLSVRAFSGRVITV